MSDGAHRFEDDDALQGRDGDDEPVTAEEMTAKLAADFGVDPAVLARECEMYAWHFAEIIAFATGVSTGSRAAPTATSTAGSPPS